MRRCAGAIEASARDVSVETINSATVRNGDRATAQPASTAAAFLGPLLFEGRGHSRYFVRAADCGGVEQAYYAETETLLSPTG